MLVDLPCVVYLIGYLRSMITHNYDYDYDDYDSSYDYDDYDSSCTIGISSARNNGDLRTNVVRNHMQRYRSRNFLL